MYLQSRYTTFLVCSVGRSIVLGRWGIGVGVGVGVGIGIGIGIDVDVSAGELGLSGLFLHL